MPRVGPRDDSSHLEDDISVISGGSSSWLWPQQLITNSYFDRENVEQKPQKGMLHI
ncbi:MAG: hypothetical protein ABEI06_01140 [Halobacteriaceae archaeon]